MLKLVLQAHGIGGGIGSGVKKHPSLGKIMSMDIDG